MKNKKAEYKVTNNFVGMKDLKTILEEIIVINVLSKEYQVIDNHDDCRIQ